MNLLSYTKTRQIALSDDWSPFNRYPVIQKAYDDHKRDIINITNYIKSVEMQGLPVRVMQNSYPYATAALHYLCFFLDESYHKQAIQEMDLIFKGLEHTRAINPNLELRSVKGVPHYHIFVKHTQGDIYQGNRTLQLIEDRIDNYYNQFKSIM